MLKKVLRRVGISGVLKSSGYISHRSFCTPSSANDAKQKARQAAKELLELNRGIINSEKAAAAKTQSQKSSASSGLILTGLALTSILGGGGALAYWMATTPKGKKFYVDTRNSFDGFFNEPKSKLLPDQLPLPPGHMPLKTLVLDLEGVLSHSQWDRKFGWRTAKRPGLTKLLVQASQMYEIVLFTSGSFMNDQPIVAELDQYRYTTFQLYGDSMHMEFDEELQDIVYCKDLNKMNRELKNLVVVTTKKEEFKPEHYNNLVHIKPFDDVNNTEDQELEKLLVFLKDIFFNQVDDVRPVIRSYKEDELLDKFSEKFNTREKNKKEQRGKGLGGFIRKMYN